MTRRATILRSIPPAVWVTAAALLLLNLWAFWPTLAVAARRWLADPQYSHGYLVPAFSVVLLWLRSRRAAPIRWGTYPGGLLLFLAAFMLRCANLASLNSDWIDGAAFVLGVGGVFALLGGVEAVRWAWPAVGFLV